jgi:hypothetical protein
MHNVNLVSNSFIRRLEMNTLIIKDLSYTEELSVDAARKVAGGFFLSLLAVATTLAVGAAKAGVFDSAVEYKSDGFYVGGKKVS